ATLAFGIVRSQAAQQNADAPHALARLRARRSWLQDRGRGRRGAEEADDTATIQLVKLHWSLRKRMTYLRNGARIAHENGRVCEIGYRVRGASVIGHRVDTPAGGVGTAR